jgi:hypothetical protein
MHVGASYRSLSMDSRIGWFAFLGFFYDLLCIVQVHSFSSYSQAQVLATVLVKLSLYTLKRFKFLQCGPWAGSESRERRNMVVFRRAWLPASRATGGEALGDQGAPARAAPAGEKDRARAHKLRRDVGKVLSYWFWTMWGGEGVPPASLRSPAQWRAEEDEWPGIGALLGF